MKKTTAIFLTFVLLIACSLSLISVKSSYIADVNIANDDTPVQKKASDDIMFWYNVNLVNTVNNKLKPKSSKIPVLLYHSINSLNIGIKYLSVAPSDFDQQMRYLVENGYTPVYFNEDTSKIAKPIIITFDDGYLDNYTNAYPILEKYQIKATVFIITKYINLPGYLSEGQIHKMEKLVSFQSHTVDHIKLNTLTNQQINFEFAYSKNVLSQITRKPVYVLSYPNGVYNSNISKIAATYYSNAVSTVYGAETKIKDNYAIKRIVIQRSFVLADFISIIKK